MTVKQAIDIADAVKPNQYKREIKVEWVKNAERRIYNEIYSNHESGEVRFVPPDENSGEDTELFAPPPYDELYPLYIEAQIDAANAEYGRYNNSVRRFEAVYGDFEKFWQSGHMPSPLNLMKY